MAIKPPEIWNRLPSVSELLEKPPVRALADRWNRSAVAGGVRSFLEELRNDLRERAADMAPPEGWSLPSIRELAEKAARYVLAQQQHSLGVAINATGRLWGLPWQDRPLADGALERMLATGREFVLESSMRRTADDVESLVCRLSSAEAALVVHSYSGALWLALSAVAAGREVLVARAEVDELGVAEPLPRLAESAGARLKEVGTTNRATAADFHAAASPNTAAILRLTPASYRVVGDTARAELDELVALARDRRLLLFDALGVAPLVGLPQSLPLPLQSAQANIAAGVDVVLLRGDGIVGGPACGMVAGRRDVVRRITDHPLYHAWRLDSLRRAALATTLDNSATEDGSRLSLPVWQLITTPVENLRNRAERLAVQLAHMEGVGSAEAVETRSQMFAALAPEDGGVSYGVALVANDGDVHVLDVRLRSASLPIIGRLEGSRLVLDLRTVLPRQDKMIVDALLGESPSGEISAPKNSEHAGSTTDTALSSSSPQ